MTPNQKKILMKRFGTITTLEKEEKCQLARSFNITQRTVTAWFRRSLPKERE